MAAGPAPVAGFLRPWASRRSRMAVPGRLNCSRDFRADFPFLIFEWPFVAESSFSEPGWLAQALGGWPVATECPEPRDRFRRFSPGPAGRRSAECDRDAPASG